MSEVLPVYDRLKERLLTCPPQPGRALQVKPLADELGVSTTPVREALTRLAAERLLVASRHRGFFVQAPSEEDIRSLYAANEAVLCAALDRWSDRVPEMSGAWSNPKPRLPGAGTDAAALPWATAELFAMVAARSGIDELLRIVRNLNDRLHRVRCIECALVENRREEIASLVAALRQRRRDELRTAIGAYHERRQALSAAICRELVLSSYFPRDSHIAHRIAGSSRNLCTA